MKKSFYKKCFGAFLLSIFCFTVTAQGFTGYLHSLESLACESDIIAIGKIESITKIPDSATTGYDAYYDCTVDISQKSDGEILKGKVESDKIHFCFSGSSEAEKLSKALTDSDRMLVMLKKYQSTSRLSSRFMVNKYIPTSFITHTVIYSILDLDKTPSNLESSPFNLSCDKNGNIIKNPKKILQIVRQWASSPVRHSVSGYSLPQRAYIKYPKSKKRIFYSPNIILMVPAEEKYREYFLKMAQPGSDNPYIAAENLWMYPGKETEKALYELVKNDTESRPSLFAQDIICEYHYRIREAAAESLRKLNKSVPDLPMTRKPTQKESQNIRRNHWTKAFIQDLFGMDWDVQITDGKTHNDKYKTTSVFVKCIKGKKEYNFILIPKQWDKSEWPDAKLIGTRNMNSEGGRYFFVVGEFPQEMIEKMYTCMGVSQIKNNKDTKGN